MVTQSYRITDSSTLRALAHPLRQRIIMELSVRHSARAADLAEVMGEPANAVSYHLRALAKAALIVEAPELARDNRDRVWKVAHPEGIYVPAEESDLAGDLFDKQYLSWLRALMAETLPEDPRATRGRYMGGALLTKDESKKLFMEIAEVLERWRGHGMDAAALDPHNTDRIFHFTGAFIGNRDDEPSAGTAADLGLESPTTSVN